MSQRTFTDDEVSTIRELYNTRNYTKSEIARLYECSVTTVCLWLNPDEQVRISKFQIRRKKNTCLCGQKLKKHVRCKVCGLLIHNKDKTNFLPEIFKYFGIQNSKDRICNRCEESFLNKYGRE